MRLHPWKILFLVPFLALLFYVLLPDFPVVRGQGKKKRRQKVKLTFPPKLPNGKRVVTVTSKAFLQAPDTIGKDIDIAKTPPKVDFLYYPGQNYEARIWSNWGDGLAVHGKYYSAIGDHNAPQGNAFVYEYDPGKKAMRLLVNLREVIGRLLGYLPGKIHSRIDVGKDGMLYFSTHRGSTRTTTDKQGYKGDWIIRCDPKSGKSEIVAYAPVPKHCIPTSVLDPDRLIFYGGTAPGTDAKVQDVQFFAYDVQKKKLLYSCPKGPSRYMIFSKSTGKVYYVPGTGTMIGQLMRFDPKKGGPPEKIKAELGLRAATRETPRGFVYTVSKAPRGGQSYLYAFNTKTEKATKLGPAAVGSSTYITTIDADPTGRYLYYIPGAHGGSERDGAAVVQYDIKKRRRKVIAFLHPYFKDKYGAILRGTFSSAVDPKGDKLYITWNVSRGSRAWDCCALTVLHIPKSER